MPLYFGKGGTGGLKYWVESAGVFALRAWSKLTPKTTEVDADAIVEPKGVGGLLAQTPDGTVAGGNARGIYSIDLQHERTLATQVASGAYANILSGGSNVASGTAAQVFSGFNNTASNYGATVVTGWANTASGIYATIYAGVGNVVSAMDGLIAHGRWGVNNGSGSFMGYAGSSANGAGDGTVPPAGHTGNRIEGSYNVIAGGTKQYIGYDGTTISAKTYCFIGGGLNHQVIQQGGVVAGGNGNKVLTRPLSASYELGFIGGGYGNTTECQGAAIVGGYNNLNQSKYGFVGGGRYNTIKCADSAQWSAGSNVLCGGWANIIEECYESFIGGGTNNYIATILPVNGRSNASNAIVCGLANKIGLAQDGVTRFNVNMAFIGSGCYNVITGVGSAIVAGGTNTLAGSGNTISGVRSFTGNGTHNTISGDYSAIVAGGNGFAGAGNTISGSNCFVGNGVYNSVAGSLNTVLNATSITIDNTGSSQLNTASGASSSSFTGCKYSSLLGSTSGTLSSSTYVCATGASQLTAQNSNYVFLAASSGVSVTDKNYVSSITSESASPITNHCQTKGFSKHERHCIDFVFNGSITAGTPVTLTARANSSDTLKNANTILAIPNSTANSKVLVGKLNVVAASLSSPIPVYTSWVDAQVVITVNKTSGVPVIKVNKVDVIGTTVSLTINLVNSATVANGIEIQVTSVATLNLFAKATFEFDLVG